MRTHTWSAPGATVLMALGCGETTGPEAGTRSPDARVAENTTLALSNTWSTKTPMLYPRLKTAAAAINGILYVVGGVGNTPASLSATLQAYNVATNTWSLRKSLPTPLSPNGASVINGQLYVTGEYSNALFVFNPTANTWRRKANIPSQIGFGAQGVIGGQRRVAAST